MDVGKKIIKYLDAIDKAYDKGITPEDIEKFVKSRFTSAPEPVETKVVDGFIRAAKAKKYRSHRNLIIRFIRSKSFEKLIPKRLAAEKKFFMREDGAMYIKGNTIEKDLSPAERRRYKFVEHIVEKRMKRLKSVVGFGLPAALAKVSKARRK
jgi:uncharacterized protein YktA (UPF0223 family)|tara:strand:+ start:139 stop:594 length:456 start_codon:yes stop_codon:yes gene_type:complete